MNVMPHSKWIECKKTNDLVIDDPKNPWEGIEYTPRHDDYEIQFAPIDNNGGLPMFRKEFSCRKSDDVKITITALGIYNVWCNGKRVGVKNANGNTVYDEFNPGWTVYCNRVMATTYDLSDYICDGNNVILVVLAAGWWAGRICCESYAINNDFDPSLALCAEINVGGEKICTDSSWKTLWGGRIRAAEFYDGEIYNAMLPSYEELSRVDFDASDWTDATEWSDDTVISTFDVPHFPKINKTIKDIEIVPFIGPEVRIRPHLSRKPRLVTVYDGTKDNGSDYGEINVTSTVEDNRCFTLNKGETALVDFGQELVGFPDLCFKTEKGAYIQIRVAEMLNDSGLISRGNDNAKGSAYTINYRDAKAKAYYIANGCEDGEHYCPMFSFFGFRYIEITATEDLMITDLTALVVGSEIEETGTMETSNKDVNQLISNILWGQRSNYLSVPTDCPQRNERLGWTGDTQFFCNTAAYNANVLEFFRKWLTDARDSQHPSGLYHDVIPMTRAVGGGGAAWSDAPLIVAYVMWRMYGDLDIIKENIDSFDTYMNWLESRGMQGPIPTYGDWLAYDPVDNSYISKAYYAIDAQIMCVLHNAVGNREKEAEYKNVYSEVRKDFRRCYIGDDGDLLPEYRKQTGYLLALHTDMFNSGEIPAAADSLERKIIENGYKLSTGFVGTAILCKTLAKFGKNNIAYSLLLQTEDPSWLYSVHQGATTVWERWNSYTLETGFGNVGMNSFNHYSFGAIQEWMYRYVAGIEVGDAGFDHLILQPKPDTRTENEIPTGQERITYVKATYNSAKGFISSEWHLENGVFRYEAETPISTTLYLPLVTDSEMLTVNGDLLNIKDCVIENGCVVMELDAGKYIFELR